LGAYEWISVKNKFFTHLLSFEESDLPVPMSVKMVGLFSAEESIMMTVFAENNFASVTLDPKSRSSRNMTYFVGPKILDELEEMGDDKSGVMQFYGFMAPKVIVVPIAKLLLNLLNWIHGHLPFGGYGLAIILLTLVVRIVFWPLTHKSALSMKKMQKLAPEVTALKEKFKDNPQKQQQEMLLLYRENKVNPMSGCLPILVQFPVFIALFFVIRSAVELRYESFLWIRDLSEPENLFVDILPFGINLLPFGMAATMLLQQRMMPTTADPAQQKIMKFMPLMMLVFMYRMPAGLMLYWSTSNLLAILQQMHTRRQALDEVEEEAAAKASKSPKSKASAKKKKKKKN